MQENSPENVTEWAANPGSPALFTGGVQVCSILLPWEPRGGSVWAELSVLAGAVCGSQSCVPLLKPQANTVAGEFSTRVTCTDSAAKPWLRELLQMGVIPVYPWLSHKSICPGNVKPGSHDCSSWRESKAELVIFREISVLLGRLLLYTQWSVDIKVLVKGGTRFRTLPSQMNCGREDLEAGPSTVPPCLSKSLLADPMSKY